MKTDKNYTVLSSFYDHLMRKIDYEIWAEYIYALASEYNVKRTTALELAAGNCKLAFHLSDYFKKVYAADLSLQMLSRFPQRKIKKVCCDMTELPFKNKFRYIYITFDSVNYLMKEKQVLRLFTGIKNILHKDGIFTFDASLESNSYDHTVAIRSEQKFNDIRYKQMSKYNPDTRIHTNRFDILMPDGSKHREIHKQKIYSFEKLFQLLERSGLKVIDCLEAFTFDKGKSTSKRIQFVTGLYDTVIS